MCFYVLLALIALVVVAVWCFVPGVAWSDHELLMFIVIFLFVKGASGK